MAVFEVGDNELPRKNGYLGPKNQNSANCRFPIVGAAKHRSQKSKIANLKSVHLITLSTRYSTDSGIVRPICFAVLRLITSSNFIGRSTGRSAGFVPLRILST